MGKTYRSTDSTRYYDGYQEGGKRKDKAKVRKIKSTVATKKVDKREIYPTSTSKQDYVGDD